MPATKLSGPDKKGVRTFVTWGVKARGSEAERSPGVFGWEIRSGQKALRGRAQPIRGDPMWLGKGVIVNKAKNTIKIAFGISNKKRPKTKGTEKGG